MESTVRAPREVFVFWEVSGKNDGTNMIMMLGLLLIFIFYHVIHQQFTCISLNQPSSEKLRTPFAKHRTHCPMISWNVQKNITLIFCWLEMVLLMEEILHQLRLVVYPIIFSVLYIPGGCLGFQNHQQYGFLPAFFLVIIFVEDGGGDMTCHTSDG